MSQLVAGWLGHTDTKPPTWETYTYAQSWQPKVEAFRESDVAILATGFPCRAQVRRHQLEDQHPVSALGEVLASAADRQQA